MSRILVVDDDPRIRSVVVQLCKKLGEAADEAADGQMAIDRIGAASYELVLLDLAMPRMDGMAVLRWLRAHPVQPAPGVVIVTALADVDGKTEGVALGALDFVEKPFRVSDLERRIKRALSIMTLERRLQGAEKILDRLRDTDAASGVEATAKLYHALEAEFLSARVGARALSCIVVSDEGYSTTLELGGVPAGEARLQKLAASIEAKLRGSDRVFRVDASEFVLLLPGTPASGARRVVEKLSASFASVPELQGVPLAIAVATYPHPEISQASQLFRAANVTLAQARAREQERVVYFEGF